jgi:hypothetical protein
MSIANASTMISSRRILRVALLGSVSGALRRLLEDVLTEEDGLRYWLVPFSTGTAVDADGDVAVDAAVVMVTWGEELRLLAAARAQAGGVPLLAILPFTDDRLAGRVLTYGAQASYALDRPFELLRTRLIALAQNVAAVEADAPRRRASRW